MRFSMAILFSLFFLGAAFADASSSEKSSEENISVTINGKTYRCNGEAEQQLICRCHSREKKGWIGQPKVWHIDKYDFERDEYYNLKVLGWNDKLDTCERMMKAIPGCYRH